MSGRRRRRLNAARLSEGLAGYLTPRVPAGREHVWHQYTMRFPGERQRVMDGLAERGIGSLIYYPVPVHRQAYLQELIPGVADQDLPGDEPPRRRGALDPGPAQPRGPRAAGRHRRRAGRRLAGT